MSTLELAPLIRDHCFCLQLQRAARLLARRYDEAFRPLGLTSWQFSLLVALSTREPPSVSRIAELLDSDRTTVTACLKPLERRGLIVSATSVRDRRQRLVKLSASGRALLTRAIPRWRRLQTRTARLLASDSAALRRALAKFAG